MAQVDYLLSEVKRWDWLDPENSRRVVDLYSTRKARLLKPVAAPVQVVAEPEVPPVETPTPASRPWANILEESNIRWFHTLGALLLVSAGIGYLRSQWNGVGRQMVALLMTLSPAACFALARKLRETLPLSSRLLCVLAAMLLPTGMIALNHFSVAGLAVEPDLWACFSFAVTAAVLLWQSSLVGELSCIYLGTLSLVLSGHALGNWLGQPSLVLGLFCFGCGAFYLRVAREQLPHSRHYELMSHLLGLLGVVASVPRLLTTGDFTPVLLFLLGATFFAVTGYLLGEVRALWGSAVVGVGGCFLLVFVMGLPIASAACGLLILSGVYSAGGRLSQDEGLIATSRTLAGEVTTSLLALVMLLATWPDLLDNFARVGCLDLLTGMLLGCVAAGYYALASHVNQQPQLGHAATASAAYAALMAAVLVARPHPEVYPLLLLVLPAGLAWWPRLGNDSLCLTILCATATGCFQLAGLLAPSLAALAYLAAAAIVVLVANRGGRTEWLYLAAPLASLAYACVVYPRAAIDHWVLAFAPLLAGAAGLALSLPTAWRGPLARCTFGLSGLLCALELLTLDQAPLSVGTLALYSAGFAWAARRFESSRALSLASALLVPPLGIALFGSGPAGLAVVLCLAGLTLAAGQPVAGLIWSGLIPFLTTHPWLAVLPVLAWLLGARGKSSLWGGRGAMLLLLVGVPHSTWSSLTLVCLVAAALYARREECSESAGLAWVAAGLAWLGVLQLVEVPQTAAFVSWWLFNLMIFCGGKRWQTYAGLTATLVLAAGLVQTPQLGAATLLTYGLALSWLGWQRRSTPLLVVGQLLLAVGPGPLLKHASQAAWLALLATAQALASHSQSDRKSALDGLSLTLAALVALSGFGQGAMVLGLACLAFTVRGLAGLGRWNHIPAFLFGYLGYLDWLGWGALLELQTTPPALWLIGWALWLRTREQPESSPAGLALGQLVLLGGPWLASVNHLGHALFVALAGTLLLVAGVGLGSRSLIAGGSLGLLAEMLLRAAKIGVMLPWQLTAALVGITLIGLGIVLERRMLGLTRLLGLSRPAAGEGRSDALPAPH
ncbi:MAG: hypothetical protein AB7S38_32780 [Vulcanimicrobiota bacterium]